MPTFNEYADSNQKDGTYIRAYVGDDGIVTLQTTSVAVRLFEMLEYSPPAVVPTKLIWEMHDVGLLYTGNSTEGEEDNDGDPINLLDDLDDSSLSPDEKAKIIEQLGAYSGPQKETVEELAERLGETAVSTSKNELDDMSGTSLLRKWAMDPSMLFYSMDSYMNASIQTFINHPHFSPSPIWISEQGYITYKLEKDGEQYDVYIMDHRTKPDYDFKIRIEHTSEKQEYAWVKASGETISYENEAGGTGSRMHITTIGSWVIPPQDTLVDIPVERAAEINQGDEGIHRYGTIELEPIKDPESVENSKLIIAEVDRISQSGNPIVELVGRGDRIRLDQGEPGKKYLVECVNDQKARVISRVV